MVESQAKIRIQDEPEISTVYYLVTDEKTLIYNGNNWEELYNPTPREAAALTPELYEKAEQYTEPDEINQGDTPAVPSPKEGDFTE